jgi:hypothetical protein
MKEGGAVIFWEFVDAEDVSTTASEELVRATCART